MSSPSHRPWFHHPINISWSVQVTKLLRFLPFRSKYSPQHRHGSPKSLIFRLVTAALRPVTTYHCLCQVQSRQHLLCRSNTIFVCRQ
jgi:hypothetical protein